ncbi:MAG TPA: glycosyltransferase family 10 [Bacteroidia bacterium]|jgi:hypothetical protein|nr:glycosyltransferase family 10 [Bacteroidia bacterium]
MLVFVQSNYAYPDILRQSLGGKGKWGDVQFTFNDVTKCDYVVILNHPIKDIHLECRKGGNILLIQEPPYSRNDYLKSYFSYFDKIVCAYDKNSSNKIINTHAALPWHIHKNYDELKEMQWPHSEKKRMLSWVTSNSNVNPGHEPRLAFMDFLRKSDVAVDLFGRGIQPIENKFDGIYPYKYTLAIENYSDDNYWTEKIADAFLSYTMPIYYGCKNIETFFPKGSFLKIDIHKPQEAIEIIKQAIKDNAWEKNREAIQQARELVLDTYQFFPFVTDLIKKMNCPPQYVHSKILADPYVPKGLLGKIKKIFN